MTHSTNTFRSDGLRTNASPSAQPGISPADLNYWFPPEQQHSYIAALMERGGLTRLRAHYFVRLWGYLLLKQEAEANGGLAKPLTQLQPLHKMISCTHREAAELFYEHRDRGSDRAAGLMIDRFVALGVLEKRFDGQTICLRIRIMPELKLEESAGTPEAVQLITDAFNPRTDAIPVANLVINQYAEIVRDTSAATATRKAAKFLRKWAQDYPPCMRVLRRSDNLNPVAISILYPATPDSEENFFSPPSRSFFLTQPGESDPYKMAAPGDPDCTSVFVRAWVIDTPYMQGEYICQFLEDTQQTLMRMQADFPNLCDLYSIVIHPMHEELRKALGFQKTFQDPQRSSYWIYLGVDRFLEQDMKQVLTTLRTNSSAKI
jgi:hypothetical protein